MQILSHCVGSDMFEMIAKCIVYLCMLCDFMMAVTGGEKILGDLLMQKLKLLSLIQNITVWQRDKSVFRSAS